jgi:hypothetical protein
LFKPDLQTGGHFFESHHRQVVDRSSPTYTGGHFFESHHRQAGGGSFKPDLLALETQEGWV